MARKKPIISPLGQWAYPGEVTIIPSSDITMKGVNYPVLGIDDLGNSQMMMPGQDYTFPGNYVTEIPQMGKGGLRQWFDEKWVDVKTGKACGRSGKDKNGRPYPACRPSKRVNETTPKTTSEMSSSEKAKFKREKTSGKRIDYNHKRREDGGETGWLDEYQVGGVRPPIYTSNPRDPRLKAYQDSLYVRRLNPQTFTPGNRTRPLTLDEKIFWKDEKTGLVPNLVEYDPDRPTSGYFGHYKKPVQPYIYKKSEVVPEVLETPVAPIEQPVKKIGYNKPIIQQFNYMSNENKAKALQKYGSVSDIPFQGVDINELKNGGWLNQYQDGGTEQNPERMQGVDIKRKRKNVSDSPKYQYDSKGNLLYTPEINIQPYISDNSSRDEFLVNPKLSIQNLNPTVEEFRTVAAPYYPIDNKLVADPKINLQPSNYQQSLEQEYVLPQVVGKSFGNLPLVKDDGYSPNRRWVSNLRAKDTAAKFGKDSYAYVLKTNPNNLVDYPTRNKIENNLSLNNKTFYDYLAKNNYSPDTVEHLTRKLPDQIWNRAEQMRVEMRNNPEIMSWANLHNVDLGYKEKGESDDDFAPKIPESIYAARLAKAGLPTNRPDYEYAPMETYIVQDPSKFDLAGYFPMGSIVKDAEQKVLNKKIPGKLKREYISSNSPEYFEKEAYIKDEMAKRMGIDPSAFDTGEYLIHYNKTPITEYTPGKKYGGWLDQFQTGGWAGWTPNVGKPYMRTSPAGNAGYSDNTRVVNQNTNVTAANRKAAEAAEYAKRVGSINQGQAKSAYEKAREASSFVSQAERRKGSADPLDYVLDMFNPAAIGFAGVDLSNNLGSAVSNTAQGNFAEAGSDLLGAGLNALQIIPAAAEFKGIVKPLSKFARLTPGQYKVAQQFANNSEKAIPQAVSYASKLAQSQINKNPRLALSLQRGRPISLDNVNTISGIRYGDVSSVPNFNKIKPNTISEGAFFKQLEKGADSLDNSLKKRVADLESEEGFRRLVEQEKDYLFYNSDLEEDALERVAKINARARIDELKNTTNLNKEAAEFASTNFLNAGIPNRFVETSQLYDNAFRGAGYDDVLSNMLSKRQGINLVKATPNYSKSVPGEIGIGYNYVGNKPIEMHEIAHSLQRGRRLNVDDQLRNIVPKKELTRDQKHAYEYFRKGSHRQEPSAFANELRESMLQSGIIPDYYSPISQQQIQDAYKYFKTKPMGTYNKNTGNFLSSTRILDFMAPNQSNSKLLSDILNKLPAVAPLAVGAAAASQLQQQKQGGQTSWLNKYK